MNQYAIIIEQTKRNFSAYAPDILGCAATGKTIEEVRQNLREAIRMHLDGLAEDGLPIPQPATIAEQLVVA
jgi:predicted RNase H-like HicB family nuclease